MRSALPLAALATLTLAAQGAQAAPKWLRLSWTDDPSTTLTATWTDLAGTGSAEIRVPGSEATGIGAAVEATGISDLAYTYSATFTALLPDTAYEYRVYSTGTWSAWHQTRTAPALGSCAHVSLAAVGDSRGEELPLVGTYVPSSQWAAIAAMIAAEQPLFVVHSGDVVRAGGRGDEWAAELAILEPLAAGLPTFVALGNHDIGPGEGAGAYFNRVLAFPADNPDGVEDYYGLVVGNVQLLVLSTETFDMDAQITWLAGQLAAHGSDVVWRVVVFHRAVWSSGVHGSNENDATRAAVLLPILESAGVDVVINGHDHDYERFHPSTGGAGTPRVVTPLASDNGTRGTAEGVVYFVSGGGGALVYPAPLTPIEGSARLEQHLNYLVLDAAGGTLRIIVRDLGEQGAGPPGSVSDLEVVTLEKPGIACSTPGDDGGGDGGPDGGAVGADPGRSELDGGDVDIGYGAPPIRGCGCHEGMGSPAVVLALAALLLRRNAARRT